MALAPYSEMYWHVDESLAVNARYDVFPRFTNVHAPLFSDQAGTLPLPNPGVTNGAGFITFFVENGDYWVHINGQAFYVIIDLDPNLTHVWPSTFRWEQLAPASVWVINHGLNSFPGVDTLDTLNQILEGDVQHLDDDTLTITFAAPVAGTAFLRR